MSKRSLSLFVVLAALLSLPVVVFGDTVVEEIVARVNNSIITRTQYQREEKQLRDEAQQQDAAHADEMIKQGETDVLKGLLDRQLLLEKGKEMGITGDAEVVKRLDEIRKQMKLDTMEDLEKAAE